jgi:spoIIIJ-associated protein
VKKQGSDEGGAVVAGADDNASELIDNGHEPVEASGKNVEEAIENGLADLGLERHDVTVEVLAEGRAGLFGIGGEPARVRLLPVSFETPEGDDVAFAQETLVELLRLMDVDAETSVRAPETPGDGVGLVKAVIDVEGDDLGLLIGRRGSTLQSLQYLLNLIVHRKFRNNAPFGVDVAGYRQRREKSLRDLAFRMADRVRRSGRSVTLEPMPANERRIVHLALSKDPTIMTSSVGEGDSRKVAIRTRR